jgi:hypothetical protein
MLYQPRGPGPTWQQSAQRAARLEPGRRQQQTRFIKHHERHTWQQSAQRAARLEPGRRQQQTRLLLRQSPVLYTCQLSLAILGKLTLEGLVLRLTYLSRVFILHQYRVSLTWPGLVFYASTLLLSRAVAKKSQNHSGQQESSYQVVSQRQRIKYIRLHTQVQQALPGRFHELAG